MSNNRKRYETYYRLNSNTLEEVCQEHTPGFLFFASECDPSIFVGGTYPWHWHTYVQFIYIMEGGLVYRTPGGTYEFYAGESGFVNSNVLHTLSVMPDMQTKYIEILFYPSVIGGSGNGDIMRKYIRPITKDTGFDIFTCDVSRKECEEAGRYLKEVYRLFIEKPECFELLIQAKLSLLWVKLFELSADQRRNQESKPVIDRLKTMVLYINEHYAEKITLQQIAEAGTCSRRECSRAFQNELHTTPFQYLVEVRVTKATQMLVNTDQSITFIGEACGFSDPGHFSKTFREKSGMSPREFRRKLTE